MKPLSSVSYENEASSRKLEDDRKMIYEDNAERKKTINQPTQMLLLIFSQYLYYFKRNKSDSDYVSQILL